MFLNYTLLLGMVEAEHLTGAGREVKFEPALMVWSIKRIGLCEVVHTFVDVAEASEILVVRG